MSRKVSGFLVEYLATQTGGATVNNIFEVRFTYTKIDYQRIFYYNTQQSNHDFLRVRVKYEYNSSTQGAPKTLPTEIGREKLQYLNGEDDQSVQHRHSRNSLV